MLVFVLTHSETETGSDHSTKIGRREEHERLPPHDCRGTSSVLQYHTKRLPSHVDQTVSFTFSGSLGQTHKVRHTHTHTTHTHTHTHTYTHTTHTHTHTHTYTHTTHTHTPTHTYTHTTHTQSTTDSLWLSVNKEMTLEGIGL